ncbi:hypothetical protein ACFPPD_25945 [Cohnella suwonensis]|uniref:Polyprenyl synthetase n=1 Tax=Cohnella suwonensis TaxID=696072 RepID=A0ABW0M1W4_9BACL
MEGTKRFEREIGEAFREAEDEASRFPAPLNEIGAKMIGKLNPLREGQGSNLITFLLPYWLREYTGFPAEACRDLAVGNVFAMLHFFLLDDAMDAAGGAAEGKDVRRSLVLGQLCHTAFQGRYDRHAPKGLPWGASYGEYLNQWAAAVAEEGERAADPRDPERLARKSAPVKLCAAVMLRLSGREERLPKLEEAIDLALATLQLSDDWADWREDLAGGQEKCNAFLTLARERIALPTEEPLDERQVRRSIFRANALGMLADIADGYGERMGRLPEVPGEVREFQQAIASEIRAGAVEAASAADRLATEGGLSYFLSNHAIK